MAGDGIEGVGARIVGVVPGLRVLLAGVGVGISWNRGLLRVLVLGLRVFILGWGRMGGVGAGIEGASARIEGGSDEIEGDGAGIEAGSDGIEGTGAGIGGVLTADVC